MNKKKMQLFLLGSCVMLAGGCKQAPVAEIGSEYEVMEVSASAKEIFTTYPASIRGRQDTEIYPQVSGYLTRLLVEEGQPVKKGQVMFVIDQVPYRTALETASADVEVARAALETARLTYDSKVNLHAHHVISDFDLQTAKNSLAAAEAQLAQAKAQESNARNDLSYTEVKSPSDGVVGMLPYRVGTLVSSGMAQPLTTVSDNTVMYAYFSMTERQLLELTTRYGGKDEALRQMSEIRLRLSNDSIYGEVGRIETISGVVERSTGTVSLRASFPNGKGMLYSGTSGNIVLPTTLPDCIVIPQAATFEIQNKVFVYKVQEGRAQSAPVEVMRVNGGKEYVVTAGLMPGDVIVTEGVGLLAEGTPITRTRERKE